MLTTDLGARGIDLENVIFLYIDKNFIFFLYRLNM